MILQPLDLNALGPVDWARLAFPQEDGYDTAIFEKIVGLRWGWKHRDPEPGRLSWLDGQVAIDEDDSWGNNFALAEGGAPHVPTPGNHDRWRAADEVIRAWPAQRAQFKRLINSIRSFHIDGGGPRMGCNCGSFSGNPFFPGTDVDYDYHWGRVWATHYSNTGFLEGIVHELAHWKGYALGIYIEEWENLIFANEAPSREHIDGAPCRGCITPEEAQVWVERGLGFQPLRPQMMRPLGACFQEQWCCVHMVALHLKIAEALPLRNQIPFEADWTSWSQWVENHVKRTYMAHQDMVRIVQASPGPGADFWHSYCNWVMALMAEAIETYHIEDIEDYEPACYSPGA